MSQTADDPAGQTEPHAAPARRNLRAIAAMVAAAILYGISDAGMKFVAGPVPAGEAVFLRSLGVVGAIAMVSAWTGALGQLRRAIVPLMGIRSLVDGGNSMFFQSALARMSLPDAMAILQLSPLSMTAFSALLLGANVGWRRWSAVGAGLVGALLVIKPGSSAFNAFGLLVVLAVICGTLRDITARSMDQRVPPLLVLLVSQAGVALLALVYGTFEVWRMPDLSQCGLIGLGAVFFAGGHLATIYAVRDSDWAVVAPFRYAGIVWAMILGAAIWGDVPDVVSLAGIAILIAAGLYTFRRERRLRRAA